ncbi:hypothetical protein pneo_cds_317 [Pandoravirus neocaledonia]|uniref:Uncharacterized protein n=1 Tax=Pandoravirus neocaledonia TaxID=2107708 RepID=A0A2U7UBV6_9VIRU|nr:hypothetical protein pneo_cds_317 [Pandoravirus neocaledonia]AVK75924.1 hypothetical protein pneo_cds_317 [Pandoravirus neocaledonia]
MQATATTSLFATASGAEMRPQPSRNPPGAALQAAYDFLAANSVATANEVRAAPWPGTLKPVIKDVEKGPRGGGFYYTEHGTKVYLKKKQRKQCRDGTLLGSGGVCPDITGYAPRGAAPAEQAALDVVRSMGAQRSRGRAAP